METRFIGILLQIIDLIRAERVLTPKKHTQNQQWKQQEKIDATCLKFDAVLRR